MGTLVGSFGDPVVQKKLHSLGFDLKAFARLMVLGCKHLDPHVHRLALLTSL